MTRQAAAQSASTQSHALRLAFAGKGQMSWVEDGEAQGTFQISQSGALTNLRAGGPRPFAALFALGCLPATGQASTGDTWQIVDPPDRYATGRDDSLILREKYECKLVGKQTMTGEPCAQIAVTGYLQLVDNAAGRETLGALGTLLNGKPSSVPDAAFGWRPFLSGKVLFGLKHNAVVSAEHDYVFSLLGAAQGTESRSSETVHFSLTLRPGGA